MWGGVVANREPGSYIIIISKLRIAWEIHVYAVSASKNPEKMNFFGELSKTCFLSADTYSEHGVSPIAEGVEFLLFFGLGCRKNNDILGIYFVRNNCVFSDAPELVQNKIPKKLLFWGIFPDVFLIIFPFPGYVFTLCFLGGPRCLPAKRVFFRTPKKCPKNDIFSRETIRWFLAPALSLRRRIPYLSANRLEPRISRDQHIQTCQSKTTNVKIHPAVPKVYTHFISFGQM